MPTVKTKLIAVKNHVHHFRGRYAALVTASVFVSLNLRNAKLLDQFLAEKGLLDEYYALEED